MNWIRIATGIKDDPAIGVIADACKVRVPESVGLVVCLLLEFPNHARNGDISQVPDSALERWAGWHGRKGQFAKAFREHLCNADGVVRSWEKHNGAAIREADRALERAKEWRKNRKRTPDETATEPRTDHHNERGNVRRTVRGTNGVTNGKRTHLRDGTGRDELPPPSEDGVPPSPATRSPAAPVPDPEQLAALKSAALPHEAFALDVLLQTQPHSAFAIVAELHASATAMPGHELRGKHSGRRAEAADVMRAVSEYAACGKPWDLRYFRGFVRSAADRKPEPPSTEEREAERLARQIAAHAPAGLQLETPRTPEELEATRQRVAAAREEFRKLADSPPPSRRLHEQVPAA